MFLWWERRKLNKCLKRGKGEGEEVAERQNHTQSAFITKLSDQIRSGHLVDMSPVLSAVVETFPHHAHDLSKRHHVEGQVSDLWHERWRWAPRIIGGGLANLRITNRSNKVHLLHFYISCILVHPVAPPTCGYSVTFLVNVPSVLLCEVLWTCSWCQMSFLTGD